MTLVLNATAGDPAANSFPSEVEAIAFAATRLNLVGWTTLTGSTCTDLEKQALIEATREISALTYQNCRTTTTQALSWPRQFAPNPDAPFLFYFDATVIPQRVKDATCELAFEFLKAGASDIATLDDTLAVIRKSIGGAIDTQYALPSQRAQGLARFPRVMRQIGPLLGIGPGQVRLVR